MSCENPCCPYFPELVAFAPTWSACRIRADRGGKTREGAQHVGIALSGDPEQDRQGGGHRSRVRGLPLIDAFVNKGFTCIGFDVDTKKVDDLNAGRSYIKHISSEKVRSWKDKKQFDATADMSRLSEADAILICVPTPLSESRDPDLFYVEETARSIAKALRKGQLVVLGEHDLPDDHPRCRFCRFWRRAA